MARALPTKLPLEVVTPEGLLLREEVDEVIAPGEHGYFGVLPGHTPFLSTLGLGEITYRMGGAVAPAHLLLGLLRGAARPGQHPGRAGGAAGGHRPCPRGSRPRQALARMKAIRDEAGYRDAQAAYVRAVTRLAVARRRGGCAPQGRDAGRAPLPRSRFPWRALLRLPRQGPARGAPGRLAVRGDWRPRAGPLRAGGAHPRRPDRLARVPSGTTPVARGSCRLALRRTAALVRRRAASSPAARS